MLELEEGQKRLIMIDLAQIFDISPHEIRMRAEAYAELLKVDGVLRIPEIIIFLRNQKQYNPSYTDYFPQLSDVDLKEIDRKQRQQINLGDKTN